MRAPCYAAEAEKNDPGLSSSLHELLQVLQHSNVSRTKVVANTQSMITLENVVVC